MKVSVLELFVKLTTGSWRLKHLCMYSMHFTMHLLHISCPIQILLFLITYLNSLHSHYFYNASMKCLWWIIDNEYAWLGSLQTNVLGSSLICGTQVSYFEYLFWYFQLRLREENKQQIFEICHVQIDELARSFRF